MGALPLLIAMAAVGGHVTFLGAITTPTANGDPGAYTATARPPLHATRVGRFDDPPRRVRVEPRRGANAHAEVVITYL